jgi:hypothetical protein
MQDDKNSMSPRIGRTEQLKASILDILSSDPHLTDAELIEFSSGTSTLESNAIFQQHVESCPMCATELNLLSAHLAVWDNPSEIERLEARIGRPEVMGRKPAQPWWVRVTDWVPLASPKGAYSAHASAIDIEVINFPVHGESEIATELSGIIHKRGQEFQIRITPSGEQTISYKDRLVEVVLVELGTENVLLQRNIPIDRFVLLGTDLPIRTEKIAAKLLT